MQEPVSTPCSKQMDPTLFVKDIIQTHYFILMGLNILNQFVYGD
jgi:hypothetical protein